MTRRVLVTGGLGYVGGRVVRYLSQHTDDYIVVGTRRKDIPKPDWLHNGTIVPFDFASGGSLEDACRGITHVVHLAAMNEIECAADPEKAMHVNGIGTLKLLRAAEHAGVERFIYFSTAHVYGAPLAGKITEKTLARPVHPYAISHRAAEDVVLAAHDGKRITSVVLRLSNGIGAPVTADVNRWTLVGNDLCRQAVETNKLVLKSSGLQQRDFIAIGDVCRAVLHFLDVTTGECDDALFNLGGENVLSILDLAGFISSRCRSVLGFAPAIERPDPIQDERILQLDYDISKLKGTGFILKGSFSSEIDDTIRIAKCSFDKK